jgi:putative Mn2+ efflux pump MntP
MKKSTARNLIGGFIIFTYMITSAIIVLYSLANDLKGTYSGNLTLVYFKEYFSISSGIVGIVIGYYFGTTTKKEDQAGSD